MGTDREAAPAKADDAIARSEIKAIMPWLKTDADVQSVARHFATNADRKLWQRKAFEAIANVYRRNIAR